MSSTSPQSPAPRHRFKKGFTLLEMLAVIVLLGIVGVIVARSVSGRVDTGKWDAGKIGVTKLDQDVQAYALDNGSPPKSLDDLITKPLNAPSWNGPYAKPADLTDPFGHPYGYLYPGKHGQYDIIFYGRDGKPGGEGIDRDYGNWQ
ncbi:MAG TPA: type II secretion system major pseudopilin GspG [Rhodanobacteraceae bacterium]|nr:type II secretion system major pseudopilin GspG [Rhodanobacteraceae bacterium]